MLRTVTCALRPHLPALAPRATRSFQTDTASRMFAFVERLTAPERAASQQLTAVNMGICPHERPTLHYYRRLLEKGSPAELTPLDLQNLVRLFQFALQQNPSPDEAKRLREKYEEFKKALDKATSGCTEFGI